jgi:hypothetical protein
LRCDVSPPAGRTRLRERVPPDRGRASA